MGGDHRQRCSVHGVVGEDTEGYGARIQDQIRQGGLAQEVAQAQLEARKPAEQDRGRVVARAPLEAKRRGCFSCTLV